MANIIITKAIDTKKEIKYDFVLYSFNEALNVLKNPEKMLLKGNISKNTNVAKEIIRQCNYLKNNVYMTECNYKHFRPQLRIHISKSTSYLKNISYEDMFNNIIEYFGSEKLTSRFIKKKTIPISMLDEENNVGISFYVSEFQVSEAIIPLLETYDPKKEIFRTWSNKILDKTIVFFKEIIRINNQDAMDFDDYINKWVTEIKIDSIKGFQFKKTRHNQETQYKV